MDEQHFRIWLAQRRVDEETINAIVEQSNFIQKTYADLATMGGAIDHEWWLDGLTSSVRGDDRNQVIWVLIGMTGALMSYLENGE